MAAVKGSAPATQPAPKATQQEQQQPAPRLRSAGESTDPTVHHLIAELQAARSNGDTTAEVRILGRLQALGFTA